MSRRGESAEAQRAEVAAVAAAADGRRGLGWPATGCWGIVEAALGAIAPVAAVVAGPGAVAGRRH